MVDKKMVVPAIEEVVEPVAEAEEEQVITPAVDMEEGQMGVLMLDIEKDLAVFLVGAQVKQGQQTVAQRDEMVAELTQQVHALQIDVQQRDRQIQQLQTIITKMGSRESTLMRYIL
nr:hypothetical protein [Tanacetum cinerariifolium]